TFDPLTITVGILAAGRYNRAHFTAVSHAHAPGQERTRRQPAARSRPARRLLHLDERLLPGSANPPAAGGNHRSASRRTTVSPAFRDQQSELPQPAGAQPELQPVSQ